MSFRAIYNILFFLIAALPGILAGCASQPTPAPKPMVVSHAAQQVVLDGRLDEDVWQNAQAYPLGLPASKLDEGQTLQEGGQLRLACDDQFLYVGISFDDRDISDGGTGNEEHLYQTSDLAEVFLLHVPTGMYWELYVTPKNLRTSMFYPSDGYRGRSDLAGFDTGLQTAVRLDGTLNNWRDEDRGWSAEMAIPISHLEATAGLFRPGTQWTAMLSRYNWGRYLSGRELSSTSPLTEPRFHETESYRPLILPGQETRHQAVPRP